MSGGAPPASGEDVRSSERLDAARGSVRDALGSLRNLEQLLRSIKVGPRALASVLPSVHASCAPLLVSCRELLDAIGTLGDAPRAIEAFVTPRLGALEDALAAAMRTPLHARQRLALESAVSRAASDLEAGCALVDLLERARSAPATPVSLVEVTHSARRAPTGPAHHGLERVSGTLTMTTTADVLVTPRVATELLRIATRMVVAAHPGVTPHVRVGPEGADRSRIQVSPRPVPGESILLLVPPLVEPTVVSANAAAQTTGGELCTQPDGSVTLTWAAGGGE